MVEQWRVRIKFCGITLLEDALASVRLGVDALGFVFFKESPRYIKPELAKEIIKNLPPFVSSVGIFVNEDIRFIEECIELCGLNAVQLHGDEDIDYCMAFKNLLSGYGKVSWTKGVKLIKAIRIKDRDSIRSIENCPADAFLLDTYKSNVYGGTGQGFDRSIAILAKEYGKDIIVAGGLTPNNVYKMIKDVRPYGVDVSSGIESSPGKKNLELMEEFVKEVRRAEKR